MDLKEVNILVMEDGTIKLADFGVSQDNNNEYLVTRSRLQGSRLYLSKEVH